MALSLVALATASGLYPLFPNSDTHALVSLFVLIGSIALIVGAKPRLQQHSIEPIVIVVPLALVSVLCNAMMARLGIGLKVATLPVIALGVGVGVGTGAVLAPVGLTVGSPAGTGAA